MKEFSIWVGIIVVLFVLTMFVFPAMGLYQIQFWGVKYADANRKVFEHSQSYNQGMIRDMENLRLSYLHSNDPAEKAAILDTARHRAAGYNTQELPADLQQFVNQP